MIFGYEKRTNPNVNINLRETILYAMMCIILTYILNGLCRDEAARYNQECQDHSDTHCDDTAVKYVGITRAKCRSDAYARVL